MPQKKFNKYRFAVQILFFDCDQFILRTIANCAPYVEKIFVTYSPEPWSAYNKNARESYKNSSNPEILKKSIFYEKIELISGVWNTEEEQRNECLEKAKAQGFDYLIIQDADEFYLPEEYEKNLLEISLNPDFDFYRNPWLLFWKNTKNVIVSSYSLSNGTYSPYTKTTRALNANYAVNLGKDVRFNDRRMVNSSTYYLLSGICLHLSYVMNDSQLLTKLNTWGHSHQLDIRLWYKVKWLGWQQSTRFFNPFNPIQWVKTIEYAGKLPQEIEDFQPGEQKHIYPHTLDYLKYFLKETLFKALIQLFSDIKYASKNGLQFRDTMESKSL